MKRKSLLLLGLVVLAGFVGQTVMARNFADIDVIKEIKSFNKSVSETAPEYFRSKMQLMSEGIFPFLRGTAHLMNLDMMKTAGLEFLRKAPAGLVAGDLHMHNFSILKADGKIPTYAIDDLDEAFANAPLSFDVFRLSVSMVAGLEDRFSRDQLQPIIEQLYAGYIERAADNKSYDWPQFPVSGFIKEFIDDESDVKWSKFIKKKTLGQSPNAFDFSKHEEVPAGEKKIVVQAMRGYLNQIASSNRLPVEFTEIIDVAQRFDKGLSSIGLKRYFILLRGETAGWEDDRIIEVKLMRTSSVCATNSVGKQSKDTLEAMNRAHQGRDSYLGTTLIGGKTFLVRQNFPWSETIENTSITEQKHAARLAFLLGYITADFHVQSGKGPAMKAWLEKSGKGMVPWVFSYADQLKADWKIFRKTKF